MKKVHVAFHNVHLAVNVRAVARNQLFLFLQDGLNQVLVVDADALHVVSVVLLETGIGLNRYFVQSGQLVGSDNDLLLLRLWVEVVLDVSRLWSLETRSV